MKMFKIPSFLSKKFGKCETKQKKDALIESYKSWYSHEITKLLVEDLEKQLKQLQEEEDLKFDFVSLFQSKHTSAHYKGQRKIIKQLLQQFNHNYKGE